MFTIRSGRLHVLLVRRAGEPFAGRWALPGGFLKIGESAEAAAVRELAEEAFVGHGIHLEQLATYSDPGRDPRMRVVSVAHVALAPNLPDPRAGSDAAEATWWPVDGVALGELAFDHDQILADALMRVRAKLEYTTLATEFLPRTFSMGELRAVYTAVWGGEVGLPNFRRKVLSVPGFIEPSGEVRVGVPGPRAQLFKAGPSTEIVPPFNRHRMMADRG
ncbi:MAG: NUDIX hydrolase [Micropruina sp.]|nr:NUDIX hydrolase [Micropruina sp.]